MPATPTLTPQRNSTDELSDAETLALLDELDVPLPTELADFDVDLDIAFGTPLEMHEPFATVREKDLPSQDLLEQFFARRQAALDIVADDPSITTRVRERLVDVLLPYADRLRQTIRSGCRPEYAAA
ncbi:hypothetical protein PV387_09030 [Streptomyces sp. ME02-6987-2C]|uniref:hypothetical protein n=1 Tax=unclassified Streptomyces TaxID=2593676 RepID=UPI0029BF3F8C|nr:MULTISPECIES: hypothetical protein [unclassified Streptomyces]MDX3366173.1 hypothetical protein [Streptomyces sp. ME02-6987-2C]MDX3426020.1 hypothetical protein [Streptomyces sp. ME02-6985-2c]